LDEFREIEIKPLFKCESENVKGICVICPICHRLRLSYDSLTGHIMNSHKTETLVIKYKLGSSVRYHMPITGGRGIV